MPKLFFLHLPKTAGTTLNRVLEDNFGRENILSVYTREEMTRFQHLTRADLASIKAIQGHVLVTDYASLLNQPEIGIFTFLRHPVDRLLSEYFFLKNWPEHHLYDFLNRHDITLREYVTSRRKELVYRGKNFMTRILSGVSFGPLEQSRDALDLALEHLTERFLMFGLVERFDESLLLLKRCADLKSVCYERHNVHLKRPGRQDIDSTDLEVLMEHNRLDVALYEQAKKTFEKNIAGLGAAFVQEFKLFEYINSKYQNIAALLTPKNTASHGRFQNLK